MIHCRFISILVAICLYIQPADAMQKKHIEAFKNYNAALAVNDEKAAIEHSKTAWMAGEEELGDSPTTAVLAYNYAQSIYYSDPANALAPLERTIELSGENLSQYGNEQPLTILLFTSALLDPDDRDKIKEFEKQLLKVAGKKMPPSLVAARGWKFLTVNSIKTKKAAKAIKYGALAEEHYRAIDGGLNVELADTMVMNGIAHVTNKVRTAKNYESAALYFDKAISMFPPQKGINEFDPLLASALAWRAVTRAVLYSDEKNRVHVGSRIAEQEIKLPDTESRVKWAFSRPAGCTVKWEKREKPSIPSSARNRRYQGGVIVGFNFADDGTVANATILAEVPSGTKYGEATRDAILKWKADRSLPEGCRNNYLSTYSYSVY